MTEMVVGCTRGALRLGLRWKKDLVLRALAADSSRALSGKLLAVLVGGGPLCQCCHSKGIFFVRSKPKRRGWILVHTGNMDGFWRAAKKAVPGFLSSKINGKRNVHLWRCLRRYQWRWENTGKDLCQRTAETVLTL